VPAPPSAGLADRSLAGEQSSDSFRPTLPPGPSLSMSSSPSLCSVGNGSGTPYSHSTLRAFPSANQADLYSDVSEEPEEVRQKRRAAIESVAVDSDWVIAQSRQSWASLPPSSPLCSRQLTFIL
jgi:hypothetical protein